MRAISRCLTKLLHLLLGSFIKWDSISNGYCRFNVHNVRYYLRLARLDFLFATWTVLCLFNVHCWTSYAKLVESILERLLCLKIYGKDGNALRLLGFNLFMLLKLLHNFCCDHLLKVCFEIDKLFITYPILRQMYTRDDRIRTFWGIRKLGNHFVIFLNDVTAFRVNWGYGIIVVIEKLFKSWLVFVPLVFATVMFNYALLALFVCDYFHPLGFDFFV